MHGELAVTNEIHEAFVAVVDEITVFVALRLRVINRRVFLLKINHVRAREDTFQLDNELGDTLFLLFICDFPDTGRS